MKQLSLFGASEKQDTFMSMTWGLTTFFQTKDDQWAHNCKLCILNRSVECCLAPCTVEERADGQRGYYSIHNMPDGTQH